MCLTPSLAGEDFIMKIKINGYSILKFKMSGVIFPFLINSLGNNKILVYNRVL